MLTVLIDGANLYATCKELGVAIDYKALRLYFGEDLLRISYYTALLPGNAQTSVRPLVDWLSYNGYSVVTKDAKEWFDSNTGVRKIKGNMDCEITVDALEAASHTKKMWLFTGDGDFTYLVNSLKRQGVHVTVVSTIETKPAMIADELRRACDTFVDLRDFVMMYKDNLARKSKWA